jgi:hypothetical protein
MDLEWTIDLGDAEVNQPFNVAEVIQQLRAEAEKAGSLKTTPEQIVTISSEGGESLIVIEPAEPSTIYVPNYDWATYGSPEALIFGVGVAIGAGQAFDYWQWCDWRTGAILVWAGRPGTHPPFPGWRPGQPACTGAGCDALSADVDASLKPWRPSADYRAGLGSKPGFGANRLNGVGGPVQPLGAEGGPGRPAIGARGASQAPCNDGEGANRQGQLGVGAAPLPAPAETFAPEGRFEGRFARRGLPAELFPPARSLRAIHADDFDAPRAGARAAAIVDWAVRAFGAIVARARSAGAARAGLGDGAGVAAVVALSLSPSSRPTAPRRQAALRPPCRRTVLKKQLRNCYWCKPYFVCSGVVNGTACGRRVTKLHGPGRYFLCRHCYRLAHASQSEDAQRRSMRRVSKIMQRLGGNAGTASSLPPKPKGSEPMSACANKPSKPRSAPTKRSCPTSRDY